MKRTICLLLLAAASLALAPGAEARYWLRQYSPTVSSRIDGLTLTPDGGFLTAGEADSDLWLTKMTRWGFQEWNVAYNAGMPTEAAAVLRTFDDGFLVVGSILNDPANMTRDVFVLRVNADGDPLWAHTYGTAGNEVGAGVARTISGDYLVGATGVGPFGGTDMYRSTRLRRRARSWTISASRRAPHRSHRPASPRNSEQPASRQRLEPMPSFALGPSARPTKGRFVTRHSARHP